MSETIERLEDLDASLQVELLDIASGESEHCSMVENYRLLDYRYDLLDSDDTHTFLTERGAELVADYQRRHDSAASLKDWNVLDSRIISDSVTSVETLQAEIARLQAENATLQNIIDGLLQFDAYGVNTLDTLTYELGRYGASTESKRDAIVAAVGTTIKRLRSK